MTKRHSQAPREEFKINIIFNMLIEYLIIHFDCPHGKCNYLYVSFILIFSPVNLNQMIEFEISLNLLIDLIYQMMKLWLLIPLKGCSYFSFSQTDLQSFLLLLLYTLSIFTSFCVTNSLTKLNEGHPLINFNPRSPYF